MNFKDNIEKYVFDYKNNVTILFKKTRKCFEFDTWSKFKQLFYAQCRPDYLAFLEFLSVEHLSQFPLSSSEKLEVTESILKEL
jgi:hypothetical protein